ncbi:hypothetical protein HC251_17735 [Iamia sp. SCSIO 61187]|uniref:hypothetical protein n=1 Tax=Iamia sp. SCSIO 61187 TaxID=2722752 RepID=UPI001C636E12|nr:hypothetical protein [Iamia sp. SCSIO 61187]QYG94098.1 hypothetical protein HC251_17735 [Iamia sp. SCSIO 61187]
MPQPTCSTPRPLPPALVDELARQIAGAHVDAAHASLVRLRPGADGVEVGLCALPDGVHPADALVGQVVPAPWTASGVVAPARARSLDGPDEGGTRTVVAMLVTRDGHLTSHAVDLDGADLAGLAAGGEAPVGRLPDLLRRTLGLPTTPPRVPAAEWWRVCWLDAVVTAAAGAGGTVDADHPLTSTLPSPLVRALVDDPTLCAVEGWGRIRALAAAPEPPSDPAAAAVRRSVAPFVDPPAAAWMDDGCFARWLLAALPSVDELLALADDLVPADVAAQLRAVARPAEAEP